MPVHVSPFADQYHRYFVGVARATGYDFGAGPRSGAAPPVSRSGAPPAWWSLDRPSRIAAHLARRDRALSDILALQGAARQAATRLAGDAGTVGPAPTARPTGGAVAQAGRVSQPRRWPRAA